MYHQSHLNESQLRVYGHAYKYRFNRYGNLLQSVLKRDIYKKIMIVENRFGFEPEIAAKVCKLRTRIYEVGISYSGRDYSEGEKIGWKDSISAFRCIIKNNVFR